MNSEEEPPPAPESVEVPDKRGKAPADFVGSFSDDKAPVSRSKDRDRPERIGRGASGRLFIGNLESENISKQDFLEIFSKYGKVVDVSMHAAFGFVQYANEDEMNEAMRGEQGRQIGSRNIDIQVANKQRDRNNNNDGNHNRKRRRDGDNGHYGNGDDNRSRRGRRENSGRFMNDRMGHVPPPRDGAVMKIILLGEQQRDFAQRVADEVLDNGVPVEMEMLDGRSLSQALRDCEGNLSRYACIVGRENLNKGTTTIKLLHLKEDHGRCPTYDLRTPELIDLVVSEERKLGFQAGPRMPHPAPIMGYPPNLNLMMPQAAVPLASSSAVMPPTALLQMQQQLNALSQQLSAIQQPHHQQLAPPIQAQPSASNAAAEMQAKIMQELGRLQEQAAKIPNLQAHTNLNLSAYPSVIPQSSSSASAPKPANSSQIADLSKLLSNIRKIKRDK